MNPVRGHLSPDYQNFLENYPRNGTIRPAAAYVLKRVQENAPLEEVLNLIQGHGCGGISSSLVATAEEEKIFYQALKIIDEKNPDKRWVIPAAPPESPNLSNAHFIEYVYWGIQNAHLPVELKKNKMGVNTISINNTPLSNIYFGIKPTVPFIHPYNHYSNPDNLKLFGWINKKNPNSPYYGVCIQQLTLGDGPQQLKPHYALDPNAPYFQKNYNKIFNTHATMWNNNNLIINERGNCHIHAGQSYNVLSPVGLFSANIQQGQSYISKVICDNQQFITFHWIVTEEEDDVFTRVIDALNHTQVESLGELINLFLIEDYDALKKNKNFDALCHYLGILKN